MFLDEEALKIITRGMGLSKEEGEAFIANYFDVLAKFMMTHVVGYISEHEPERMDEINKMFESQNAKERVKGQRVLIDQVGLFVASYQDLEEDIKEVTKEYDNAMFFNFLGRGPEKEALELIEYLSDKIQKATEYPKILKMVETRFGKKAVDEFFEEKSSQ